MKIMTFKILYRKNLKNYTLVLLIIITTAIVFAFKQKETDPPKPYGPLPSESQLKWHETEIYCIIHFGLNTFTDKAWGYGDIDPQLFNPSAFNAGQIVNAANSAHCKGLIIVAKHHDGFCLWPTKTTEYNISKSPFKGGKGDLVKEFKLACLDKGLKFAIYCSPWDRNNAAYGKPEYINIYREQLVELYRNYGDLFMSWHDGANGGDGYYGGTRKTRLIDKMHYYQWDKTWLLTRKLQPNACIFSDVGWDVRWIGNEEGEAGETCWATYTPKGRDVDSLPGNGNTKYWEATEGHRNGKFWMPGECDVPLRPEWFYHKTDDDKVKTLYALFDLYMKSVGRGADLDLGLSPDTTGKLPNKDEAVLKSFGDLLDKTFSTNLAIGAHYKASNIRGGDTIRYGTANLTDNDRYSYWTTDDKVTCPNLEINLETKKTFNIIRLKENIKLGQRIEALAIDQWQNDSWTEIAKVTSIGSNRIIRFPFYITCQRLRLRITKSPVCPALSDFGLFAEPMHLSQPTIRRNIHGIVSLVTISAVNEIRYTLDGSDPTDHSILYVRPFTLHNGGIVKALSMDATNLKSDISLKSFGVSKEKWKVIYTSPSDKNKKPELAIDEDEYTSWSTTMENSQSQTIPQEIVVDMNQEISIKAFTFLPPNHSLSDIVDKYEIYSSIDGNHWVKAAFGEFSNIKSNPVEQTISLKNQVTARYFKFIGLHVTDNGNVSIAEIGVTGTSTP